MISDPLELLQLCGTLNGDSAASVQCRIANYLQKCTNADKVLLLLVSEDQYETTCKVANDKILEEEVKFTNNSFFTVLSEDKSLRLEDIKEETREKLYNLLEGEITSLLCVPITHPVNENKLFLLVNLINKINCEEFVDDDEIIVRECCKYVSPLLLKSLAYEEERRQREQCQSLLLVAKNLFTHLDDTTLLLREIMSEARNLTKAERCSLFLLDKEQNELVAKVFDCNLAEDATETTMEVRIPADQGIAGHVATTGKLLNIYDAYSHPLFYRKLDETTGFKTRNILCFPIQDESGIIGVAELCNKKNGRCFTHFDEEIANAFSIYCAISIMHSLMWKKVRDAQHRSRLSNELMMYHMKVPEDEITALIQATIPSVSEFDDNFKEFFYTPRLIAESDTPLVVLAMFEDLGMISHWRIPRETLVRFILMVKKGYREPPYHNWMHAFSVTHFCYVLLANLGLSGNQLTELECLSLFVACLCHDLDHRGTTNSFQLASKSDLAALYSSESSVMERHHFAQCMAILNTDGCNIFESFNKKEYTQCLDNLRDLILATDLAHHLRIMNDILNMLEEGYDVKNQNHHSLLLCLLITSCDLSDQTKEWKSCKRIAEWIYQEFFSQGDIEKAMGVRPSEMMDREKACIPELQINFLQTIVLPLYQLLTEFSPEAGITVETILVNMKCWERLKEILELQQNMSSLDIFDNVHLDDEVVNYIQSVDSN